MQCNQNNSAFAVNGVHIRELELLFILIAELFMWNIYGCKKSKYLAAGVVVLLLGATGQQMGIGINQNFNHNDVYHLVSLVGLYLFYLGVINLQDFENRIAPPSIV